MPVSHHDGFLLPLLQFCGNGEPQTFDAICDHCSQFFQPAIDEQGVRVTLGATRQLLIKAGLLEEPVKRTYQITLRGKKLLKSPPEKITIDFLQRYPEFVKAQAAKLPITPAKPNAPSELLAAPGASVPAIPSAILEPLSVCAPSAPPKFTTDERLAKAYNDHQVLLAEELAARVKLASPRFFEKLVVDLLFAMGYGCRAENAAQVIGQTGDGGIDGILHEDPLGLSAVYVQAKKRGGAACIGEIDVRNFVGALQRHQPCKGVYVTTGKFTDGAKAYVKNLSCKIALIDGEQLVKFMLEYSVGVSVRQTYQIKKMDTDYFSEE